MSIDEATNRALGLHHTVPTAIADLVDNSIDAGAQHVLVRFVQAGPQLTALRVIDDGRGMHSATIASAMRYGRGRTYSGREQGHFGVGLKAASLSQADTLTVVSGAAGHDPVARRISVVDSQDAPVHQEVAPEFAAAAFERANPRFPLHSGTIVEWRRVRTFPRADGPAAGSAWVETVIGDLQDHLGLVFHRFISRGLSIRIDVFDEKIGRAGAPRAVHAIDPFGYQRTGDLGYPRTLELTDPTGSFAIAHIWPARSPAPEYKLGGLPGRDKQGFFVYRNNRLLQAGGWNGVVRARPEWGLARVAIDLDDALADHVTINPEKSGITIDATVAQSLHTAMADGYLTDAEGVARAARRVQRRPVAVVEPGAGLPDEVIDEFTDTFAFVETADPVQIGWRVLAADRFFEVDLEGRSLWLNARYRRRVGGRRTTGIDVPLLRTLVFLLAQEMFDGVRHSSRQTEQIDAWQRVLLAAMVADEESA